MVLLIVHLFRCKFLLHVIHIYRTCFSHNKDVLREKQVLHQFLLKSYDCFWGQAEISISVTLGHHSCCIGKLSWFSIIIVDKRLYFILLVLWFRWKRRFPSNEANCYNYRTPLLYESLVWINEARINFVLIFVDFFENFKPYFIIFGRDVVWCYSLINWRHSATLIPVCNIGFIPVCCRFCRQKASHGDVWWMHCLLYVASDMKLCQIHSRVRITSYPFIINKACNTTLSFVIIVTFEPGHEKTCLIPYANNKGAVWSAPLLFAE